MSSSKNHNATTPFDPEQIHIVDFDIRKKEIVQPKNFLQDKIIGYSGEPRLRFEIVAHQNMIEVGLFLELNTISGQSEDKEVHGSFHFVFELAIEDLEQYLVRDEKTKKIKEIGPELDNVIK